MSRRVSQLKGKCWLGLDVSTFRQSAQAKRTQRLILGLTMTRSSEKLSGDWEARIAEAAQPVHWMGIARWAAMLAALLIVAGTALFGFA